MEKLTHLKALEAEAIYIMRDYDLTEDKAREVSAALAERNTLKE